LGLAALLAGCRPPWPTPSVGERPVRVLAMPGGFDALECLLVPGLFPAEVTAGSPGDLGDAAALVRYDVVLVSCGMFWAHAPEEAQVAALRAYVAGGGRVLATDLAYPLVEAAWPDLVDFEGAGAAAGAAQPAPGGNEGDPFMGRPDNAAMIGPEGDAALEVTDAGMRRHTGSRVHAELDAGWAVMRDVSPDARVFAVMSALGRRRPMAIAADFPGGGRVAYSSFHGHPQRDECPSPAATDAERALAYLLAYSVSPAAAQRPPAPVAARPPPPAEKGPAWQQPRVLEDPGMEVRSEPAPPR